MARQKRVTQCPECHVAITHRRAMTCHKCGAQLYYPKRSLLGWIFIWGFFLFNGWMLLRLYFALSSLFGSYSSFGSTSGVLASGSGALSNSAYVVINLIFEWVIGAFFLGVLILMTRPRVRL